MSMLRCQVSLWSNLVMTNISNRIQLSMLYVHVMTLEQEPNPFASWENMSLPLCKEI